MSNLTESIRTLSNRFDDFYKKYEQQVNSNQISFKSLESQIGQLATRIEITEKNQFRASTEANPKRECKIITSQSG